MSIVPSAGGETNAKLIIFSSMPNKIGSKTWSLMLKTQNSKSHLFKISMSGRVLRTIQESFYNPLSSFHRQKYCSRDRRHLL